MNGVGIVYPYFARISGRLPHSTTVCDSGGISCLETGQEMQRQRKMFGIMI